MSDEHLRAGEPQLLAFVSSVMDEELAPARECVGQTLGRAPFLLAWAFEHTPASAQDVQEAYLEKVRRSAFVFWLVGSRTTDPVTKEIGEALVCQRRLIVLVLPAEHRDDATIRLLEQVRPHVKYRELASAEDLAAEVDRAVSDEISRALADLPGMSRAARLDELGRASRARCVERWQVAGIDTTLALAMAHELGIGAAPAQALPSEERPLRVLGGDMGVGKSLAGKRYHRAAIAAQLQDASAPAPVYIRARDIDGDLQAKALQACEGLGDPRQQGATVVLDGIDEPGAGAASELLSQARVLAGTWPATRVLLSSRPLSAIEHAEELAHLQQLGEAEASALVGRVAGIAVTTGMHAGWPENLRQAIRLPLFAVLLGGYLRRNNGAVPASRGELLRSLVELAIGRVDADVTPLLRRLAILSLRRSGGPVPEADVLAGEDPGLIEGTRLVVRRDRTLVFPLIVLAQWFAAESLIAGEPTPQELIDDPASLESWRYPLAIAVGTYGYAQVSALLGPLAAAHGGFASQVVEEGLAKWSQSEDVTPPPALQCAEEIRSASEAWLQGAASLKELFWPLVREGQLAPTGAHVDGAWLTTGWYAGGRQLPGVNELPVGGFAALLAPEENEREALRVLLATRDSAVRSKRAAITLMKGLLVSAAPALREGLRSLPTNEQLTRCARLRISPTQDSEQRATTIAIRASARRALALAEEAQELEAEIKPIVARLAPCLLAEMGVGAIVAAQILCAYSHQGRIRSEAAFASLAGVAPIPASSGQTVRHRLNRSGDRQLNRALHTIVLCRMRDDARTRAYTTRRKAEGRSTREIKRCLKRYTARHLYRLLQATPPNLANSVT